MSGQRLALYTFGVFRERADEPANDGFRARNDVNLSAVEISQGFIARSGYDGDPGPASWGVQAYPRFYVERGDGWSRSTLSLWENLIAPMAFCYGGIHAEALRHGREWFLKPEWPPYSLWWAAPGHIPTWTEAVERYHILADHGPTAKAFDFKKPFDESGEVAVIDRLELKEITRANEKRQRELRLL